MNIFPNLLLRSAKSLDRQRMAIISEAAVISNPVSLGIPDVGPPSPTTIFLSERSFISITRFQVTVRGSIPKEFVFDCMLLSKTADSKLCAFSIAEKSPVKCKLMSSIGST